VPRSSLKEKISAVSKLSHEPNDHKAVAPVSHERGSCDGFLTTTLRVSASKKLFYLTVGDLNAPPMSESVNHVFRGCVNVGVEQYGIGKLLIRIPYQRHGKDLVSSHSVPDGRKPMSQEHLVLAVEVDPSYVKARTHYADILATSLVIDCVCKTNSVFLNFRE
jgi:hypothetical protein